MGQVQLKMLISSHSYHMLATNKLAGMNESTNLAHTRVIHFMFYMKTLSLNYIKNKSFLFFCHINEPVNLQTNLLVY